MPHQKLLTGAMFLASEEGYSKAVMLQTRFHGLFQKLICALNASMIVKTPSTFREYNLPLIEEMLNLLAGSAQIFLNSTTTIIYI